MPVLSLGPDLQFKNGFPGKIPCACHRAVLVLLDNRSFQLEKKVSQERLSNQTSLRPCHTFCPPSPHIQAPAAISPYFWLSVVCGTSPVALGHSKIFGVCITRSRRLTRNLPTLGLSEGNFWLHIKVIQKLQEDLQRFEKLILTSFGLNCHNHPTPLQQVVYPGALRIILFLFLGEQLCVPAKPVALLCCWW